MHHLRVTQDARRHNRGKSLNEIHLLGSCTRSPSMGRCRVARLATCLGRRRSGPHTPPWIVERQAALHSARLGAWIMLDWLRARRPCCLLQQRADVQIRPLPGMHGTVDACRCRCSASPNCLASPLILKFTCAACPIGQVLDPCPAQAGKKDAEKLAQLDAVLLTAAVEMRLPEVGRLKPWRAVRPREAGDVEDSSAHEFASV